MTDFPYRSALLVPAALRDAANQAAHTVTGGAPDAEALTYSIPLSPSGRPPATHYGCCTPVSEAMRIAMLTILDDGLLPGVLFYRWDVYGKLLATNAPFAAQILGAAPWNWRQSLRDAGLAPIAPDPLSAGGSGDGQ